MTSHHQVDKVSWDLEVTVSEPLLEFDKIVLVSSVSLSDFVHLYYYRLQLCLGRNRVRRPKQPWWTQTKRQTSMTL
jgi:hypothetical protein